MRILTALGMAGSLLAASPCMMGNDAPVNLGLLGTAGNDGVLNWGGADTTANLNDGRTGWARDTGLHLDAGEPARAYIVWPWPIRVDRVTIRHVEAAYTTRAFQVQTLRPEGDPAKDADWVTRATVENNVECVTIHAFPGVSTRGVRLFITDAGTADSSGRIEEMLVHGPIPPVHGHAPADAAASDQAHAEPSSASATDWQSLTPTGMLYGAYPTYVVSVNGHEAVIVLPQENLEDEVALPWAVYHTGAGETCEVLLHGKSGMVRRLLECGFLLCSITSGSQHWGHPSAEAAHDALHTYVRQTFPVAPKVNVWVQSMGGTSGYPWVASHAEWVQRIYGVYPITNRPEMGDRNPIANLAPLARAGVKILHRHGLEDKSVPFEQNARQFEAAYRLAGGAIRLIALPGLGHEYAPEFFVPDEIADFFQGRMF